MSASFAVRLNVVRSAALREPLLQFFTIRLSAEDTPLLSAMRILTIGLVGIALTTWSIAPARADFAPGPVDEAALQRLRADAESECNQDAMRRPGEECTYCAVHALRPTCDAFFRAGGWERRCSTYDPERNETTGGASPYEIGCRPIGGQSAPAPASDPPLARPRASGCAIAPSSGGVAAPLFIALGLFASARRARSRQP